MKYQTKKSKIIFKRISSFLILTLIVILQTNLALHLSNNLIKNHELWFLNKWSNNQTKLTDAKQLSPLQKSQTSLKTVNLINQSIKSSSQQNNLKQVSSIIQVNTLNKTINSSPYQNLAPIIKLPLQVPINNASTQQQQKKLEQNQKLYDNLILKLKSFKKLQNGCLDTPYTIYCPQDLKTIDQNIFQQNYILINNHPYQYTKDFGIVCLKGNSQTVINQKTTFASKDSCQGPQACANMILKFKSICNFDNQTIWKVPFESINFEDLYLKSTNGVFFKQLVTYTTKQEYQKSIKEESLQSSNQLQSSSAAQNQKLSQNSSLKPRYIEPRLIYNKNLNNLHKMEKFIHN